MLGTLATREMRRIIKGELRHFTVSSKNRSGVDAHYNKSQHCVFDEVQINLRHSAQTEPNHTITLIVLHFVCFSTVVVLLFYVVGNAHFGVLRQYKSARNFVNKCLPHSKSLFFEK